MWTPLLWGFIGGFAAAIVYQLVADWLGRDRSEYFDD